MEAVDTPDWPDLTDDQWLTVWQTAAVEAGQVWRRYGDFVSVEDLRAELAAWAVGHQQKVSEWLNTDPPALGALGRSMYREGVRFGRREKAAVSGYRTSDEFAYSTGVVANLIPLALADDDALRSKPEGGGRSSKPASERGDLDVMCIEVRWAYWLLSPEEQDLLWVYYMTDHTLESIGTELGKSTSTIHRRVEAARRRMCRHLNGETREGPGSRRVLSNAKAQAITARQV